MRFPRKRGSTSVIVRVFIPDNTSTTGAGLTGLTYASTNLAISYSRELQNGSTQITGANILDITTIGTWLDPTAGKVRFKAVDPTNAPGLYEMQFSDAAAFGTGDVSQNVVINVLELTTTALKIGPNMVMIPLVPWDYQDGVRMGLTALPNAVPEVEGGLPTLGTSAGRIDVSGGVVKANLAQILGSAITGTAANLVAAFTKFFNITSPTGTVNSLPDAVAGTTNGLAIVGSVMGKSPATLNATDVSGNLPVDVKAITANVDLTDTMKASVNTQADTALSDVGATLTRMGLLDKLSITGNVAGSAEVTAIQNNTRIRVIVPLIIERPTEDDGDTPYLLHLYLYDNTGNMEAPDSLPSVSVKNQYGDDRSAALGEVTLVDVGHYTVEYTITPIDDLEQLLFEWTVVEGGATRLHGASSLLVDTTAVDFTTDDRSKVEAIYNKLPSENIAGSSEPATLAGNQPFYAPVLATDSRLNNLDLKISEIFASLLDEETLPILSAGFKLCAIYNNVGLMTQDVGLAATVASKLNFMIRSIADERYKFTSEALEAASSQESVNDIKTIADKIGGLIENSNGNRFTAKALETAPSGSGASLEDIEAALLLISEQIGRLRIQSTQLVLPAIQAGVPSSYITQGAEVKIKRGDDPVKPFQISGDWTGWSARFGAKVKDADTGYAVGPITLGAGAYDAATNSTLFNIRFSSTDTAKVYKKLYAEIELKRDNHTYTPLEFLLTIKQDILD